MRRFWTLVSVLVVAVAAAAAPGRSANGNCSGALPQAPAGLPGPLVVTTNCGHFGLQPDGSVVYEGPWTRPVPPVAEGYWPDLTWSGRSQGHLLIGRGMEQLWRSHRTYPVRRRGNVDAVALGRSRLAFSFFRSGRSGLYLAPYDGRERLVAHGEMPLAFTASDQLVTWRERGGTLALRSGTGRLVRRLALRATGPKVDRESKLVVFRSAGRILVFDGVSVRELASLRTLGIAGVPAIEPLGRLVAVHDRDRLAVLGYDGRLVASTALPSRPELADGVSSPMVANPEGTAVAFTATSGNTAYGSRGTEIVYVLAAGALRALPLFSEELDFKVCERMAELSWHGPRLLYASSEQRAAIVDSSGQAAPVELSSSIAQLPGISQDEDSVFDIAWA